MTRRLNRPNRHCTACDLGTSRRVKDPLLKDSRHEQPKIRGCHSGVMAMASREVCRAGSRTFVHCTFSVRPTVHAICKEVHVMCKPALSTCRDTPVRALAHSRACAACCAQAFVHLTTPTPSPVPTPWIACLVPSPSMTVRHTGAQTRS